MTSARPLERPAVDGEALGAVEVGFLRAGEPAARSAWMISGSMASRLAARRWRLTEGAPEAHHATIGLTRYPCLPLPRSLHLWRYAQAHTAFLGSTLRSV